MNTTINSFCTHPQTGILMIWIEIGNPWIGVTQIARKKLERILWMADIVRDERSDNLSLCLVDGNVMRGF